MAGTTHIKVLLTENELQLPAIDGLLNMYKDWLSLSKESAGGRKTRAANRRADNIYEEIMAFKLPPIKIQSTAQSHIEQPPQIKIFQGTGSNSSSAKSSFDGSEASSLASSEPRVRTLRPRSRTPSGTRQPQVVPSTPTQQSIRAAMKKTPDSASSANVLSAALNQQHPSVSVTKIRQLLRADSAQKRREEEKERSEQVRLQRKAKEERAEAQKKQLLEERAVTAKLKREQRLLHAAEVRKARERTKIEQKLKDEQTKKTQTNQTFVNEIIDNNSRPADNSQVTVHKQKESTKSKSSLDPNQKKKESEIKIIKEIPQVKQKEPIETVKPVKQTNKANETFQKVTEDLNNIDISICDETADEQQKKPQHIAAWAKAPGLREAIVTQFSKPEPQLQKEAMDIFKGVQLPVALEEIFGPNQAVIKRYLCRTSSAVWSTPHRPIKRASSDVLTPRDPKRHL